MRGESLTAALVAALRARASAADEPICEDTWARWLCGEEGQELADRMISVFPPAELWIALRTAHIDQFLHRRIREGIDQVVLLGAGLDTRAVRLASPGVRFFEVDHPDTQESKLAKLESLGDYPVSAAHYVSCDFETEGPVERLLECGLVVTRPTVVIWEGVVPYLQREAVVATLSSLAEHLHGESMVLFDIVNKALVTGASSLDSDRDLVDMVDEVGEPFRLGINNPIPLVVESGFRHVRTFSFDEICLELTGTYERDRTFRFQSFVLASRARSLSF